MLSGLGGCCVPLIMVELGLSRGTSCGRISSSKLASNSSSVSLDGAESGSYHDVVSSKITSRLTRTTWIERLKHLYPFCSNEYPMRMHFSAFGSRVCRFSFGTWTYAMLPNTGRCVKVGYFLAYTLCGVSSCAPIIVHRFRM